MKRFDGPGHYLQGFNGSSAMLIRSDAVEQSTNSPEEI